MGRGSYEMGDKAGDRVKAWIKLSPEDFHQILSALDNANLSGGPDFRYDHLC